jgi:hypothetical protein
MKVKEYLTKLKANRYTYYNLDKLTVKRYKNLYNYLKRNKEKEISNYFQYNNGIIKTDGSTKGALNYWLNNKNYIEYVRKFKAMEIISCSL